MTLVIHLSRLRMRALRVKPHPIGLRRHLLRLFRAETSSIRTD
jgi:hypothetical protein